MTINLSTTTASATTGYAAPSTRAPLGGLLLVNLGATVAASAAAEAWVAIVRAAGVHLAVGDPFGHTDHTAAITFGACAISIALSMTLGTALAVLINWRARRPAYTYVVVAGVLTFVSLGAPLVAAATSTGTKLTLIVAHLVAASLIVTLVARCLARRS